MASYKHRQNLVDLLNQIQVPMTTTSQDLNAMIGPTDDDLLEIEVRKMARAKAKAKGTSLSSKTFEALHPYIEWEVCKSWWKLTILGIPWTNPTTKTMVPGFEILLDYHNKVLESKKEDTTWVPTYWAYYMDPKPWLHFLEIQHALKSPYELRANDEDEEEGAAPNDDEDESNDKSDSSSDSCSNDSRDDDDSSTDSDDNNSKSYDSPYSGDDWGEPFSDREDVDPDLFYE